MGKTLKDVTPDDIALIRGSRFSAGRVAEEDAKYVHSQSTEEHDCFPCKGKDLVWPRDNLRGSGTVGERDRYYPGVAWALHVRRR